MPTFPTWPGELPRCLDPWNWRHYFLLLYWIFFRPTALKCYLYEAEPALYRGDGNDILRRAFENPAYRQLLAVAVGSTVLIAFSGTILLESTGFFRFLISRLGAGSDTPDLALTTPFSSLMLPLMIAAWVAVGIGIGWAFGLSMMLLLGAGIGAASAFAPGTTFGIASGILFGMGYGIAHGYGYGIVAGDQVESGFSLSLFMTGIFGMLFGLFPRVVFGPQPHKGFGDVVGLLTMAIVGVLIGVDAGVASGVSYGVGILLGATRIPFQVLEETSRMLLHESLAHPIWWDELTVLPISGTEKALFDSLLQGEDVSLSRLVRLAANPFQRWALQRVLAQHLHTCKEPIAFIYYLCSLSELDAYANAPLFKSHWESVPSVLQVFLSEVAGRFDPFDQSRTVELVVLRLTQTLRFPCNTPLTTLAYVLQTMTKNAASTAADSVATFPNLDFPPSFFEELVAYPGGKELKSSFVCITHSLQASSLADLTRFPALLSDLPAPQDAIRPEVIEALHRLGQISQNVAVAQAASSQLNRLAAFARASDALEELGPFIEDTVVVPEKVLLLRIRNHWRTLVAEGGGRLGQQVQHQRVVNPYVAGNPVKGNLFVGRDEILGQLEELWLKPGQVDSLVLFGHRRMGKSSILQNLPHRLDPVANWVVDFNLQTVNRSHTGSLLFDLATKMHDHLLRGPDPQLTATVTADLTVPDEAAFRENYQRAFNQWLDRLAPLMVGRRLIIAMDEYELLEKAMADGHLDQELTQYLRGVIQSRDWFVLALAGLYTLQEQCHDYWHPLFASIKPRKVSFLSPAASRRLLTQPCDDFPLDYTSETLDKIYALSHGQPYLVQLIGQNLVSHYNRQVLEGEREPAHPIDIDDLDAVIASPNFFEDGFAYFNGVWAQAQDSPPGQQSLLTALSAGPATLQQLIQLTGFSTEGITTALKTLEAHDVINHDLAGNYHFTVELMRRWVSQRPAASDS
jgi:hypothetical protein